MFRQFTRAIALAVVFTGCTSHEPGDEASAREQINEAQENVQEAKEELKDAKQDLKNIADDKSEFENEIELRVNRNEEAFTELRWDLSKADGKYDEKNRRIQELERRNRDFKRRVNEYDITNQTREKWDEFKRELRQDMDELDQDIRDAIEAEGGS